MMVVGFAFSSIAQNQYTQVKNAKRVQDGQEVAIAQNLPMPTLNTNAVKDDINRIPIGTSAHERVVRREEAHVISYNPALDLITVTMLLDPNTYDGVNDMGIVGQFYSADHGQTWTGPTIIANDLSAGPNYYTSGGLYNPAGNTNLNDAIGVFQGTVYPPTGNWRFKSYGSSTVGGANQTNYIYEETDADYSYNGYWNIFGLEQVGDEMRCLNLKPSADWGAFETAQLQPIKGAFNGTTFDWDFSTSVDMDLYQKTENNVMAWIGMWQGNDAGTEIAWSPDGQIGYMWVVGVSNEDATGNQPIVFKTTDGGDNWEYIHLDFFTDEMQAYLDPYIIEANGGLMIPDIFESTGAVDNSGNLQLFVAMGSTSADVINYPDSIGYHWVYPGDLFNLTVNDNGLENIMWIDSLRTGNVMADTEGNYCGSEGWQHRLHAARNADGSQVFFTWIETRDMENNETNLHPDLLGWSYSPLYGLTEGPTCFTEGTLYETFYFFTNAANLVYDNGGGYTLPVTQSITPAEYSSNTSTSEDAITIQYITGIEFPYLVDGLGESLNTSGISVTQNQPNPFNGTTSIEVTSNTVAPVMLEISNIMGQTIRTSNEGTVTGTKTIEIQANQMEAGIYFYTVRVGNTSVTKKMIVK